MSQSKLFEILPDYYGGVLLIAVDSMFVNFWLARNVAVARKKYNIPYPIMYHPENNEFNCIQRAHQHTLELYPQFITLLLIGGLQHPRLAIGAGAVYLLGRILFAKGYSSGDPEKRRRGEFGMLGFFTLLGSTLCFAVHHLKFTHPSWFKCNS